ncbi:helix-turn-helix domain-containing protein [Roseburia sp. 1XD42-69]|uniref:helix-turn-helix domain-containing protein n=1 Tax=Roseburia sp. 1XD42-69 TaxID=2320088 RepID=UPI000EA2A6D2|nr:helix-turn-helix transcriptional regulator [Roseburia sp. 1XD42-69]RKJ62660.1 XRE family transcriptional regulator [Roseburia sp. 1XD42-69]
MSFGENLKQFRLKSHFTQEQLAEKFQVTRQTVSKWELNQVMPETGKLVEIAEYFGVSLDEMVFGRTDKEEILLSELNSAKKEEEDIKSHDYGFLKNIIGMGIITVFLLYGFNLNSGHWTIFNLIDVSFIVILLITLGVGMFFKQFRENYLNWAAAVSVAAGLGFSLFYTINYINMGVLQDAWNIAIIPFYYGILIALLLNLKQNHSAVLKELCKKLKRKILLLWRK